MYPLRRVRQALRLGLLARLVVLSLIILITLALVGCSTQQPEDEQG
jgi:hypothetical protein